MGTLLAGVFLVCAGVVSAFFPDTFVVTTIEVLDARPDLAEAVRKAVREKVDTRARLFGRTNIFLVPRADLEAELPRRFPPIHSVQVLRKLPGTIRVALQERIPVALYFAGTTYYALDPEGMVLEAWPLERLRENTLPVVRDARQDVRVELGQRVVSGTVLTMLHDVIALLPERFHLVAKEITIPAVGAEEFHVLTNEGWTLLLDTTRSLNDQLMILEKVFAERIDSKDRENLLYLDLRVAGKVFYTLRRQ